MQEKRKGKQFLLNSLETFSYGAPDNAAQLPLHPRLRRRNAGHPCNQPFQSRDAQCPP